jgi:hypothetical protein
MRVDDRDRDNVIDEKADNGTVCLRQEHDPGRDLHCAMISRSFIYRLK